MSISVFYSPSLSRIFLQKNKKKLDSGGVEKLLVTCYVILSIILKTGFFGTICIVFPPPLTHTLCKCFAWDPSPVSKKSHRGGEPSPKSCRPKSATKNIADPKVPLKYCTQSQSATEILQTQKCHRLRSATKIFQTQKWRTNLADPPPSVSK